MRAGYVASADESLTMIILGPARRLPPGHTLSADIPEFLIDRPLGYDQSQGRLTCLDWMHSSWSVRLLAPISSALY
jgi:hypothetical protein